MGKVLKNPHSGCIENKRFENCIFLDKGGRRILENLIVFDSYQCIHAERLSNLHSLFATCCCCCCLCCFANTQPIVNCPTKTPTDCQLSSNERYHRSSAHPERLIRRLTDARPSNRRRIRQRCKSTTFHQFGRLSADATLTGTCGTATIPTRPAATVTTATTSTSTSTSPSLSKHLLLTSQSVPVARINLHLGIDLHDAAVH